MFFFIVLYCFFEGGGNQHNVLDSCDKNLFRQLEKC